MFYRAKIHIFFHSVIANGKFFELIFYLIRATFAEGMGKPEKNDGETEGPSDGGSGF